MDPEIIEFFPVFAADAKELLDNTEADLSALESNPEDIAAIDNIFRGVHTLKGSAGMFGLKNIQTIAHRMEDIFDVIRQKPKKMTSEIADKLFRGIEQMID